MTMTAFLPFDRKPQKTIAAMLCKYSNMVAKPTTGAEWMFQGPVRGGRGAMIVQIVDFRDFMVSSERDWADEVGWEWNWAIAVSVSHKRRTDEEYAFWHSFATVLKNAYDGNGLASNEIWLSSDEDGFPTTPFTIEELFPDLISSEAEDVAPSEEFVEGDEEAALPPPPPRLRESEAAPEFVEEAEEREEADRAAFVEEMEPEFEEAEEAEESEPLRLIPIEYDDDEDEDEGWGEEIDDTDDEPDEAEEEEISDAITDW